MATAEWAVAGRGTRLMSGTRESERKHAHVDEFGADRLAPLGSERGRGREGALGGLTGGGRLSGGKRTRGRA